MTDAAICDWLMDNADAPIRYRTARELLRDSKTAEKIENELPDSDVAALWLNHLKPQHRWMEHGSFDDCLENAILKAVQLGLHGGMTRVADAVSYDLAKMERTAALQQKRSDFTAILTANLLSLAGAGNETVLRFMLDGLDEMHRFAQRGTYDFYLNDGERAGLTGVPTCWKNRKHFIKPELIREYGYAYPMVYDIAGLHTLYGLRDPETDRKIDGVIRYLSTDDFHRTVADGYGILVEGGGVYHSMGWDPKYPGWFGVAEYLQTGGAPRLLFYALHASRYPAARETKWFRDLLACLEAYQTNEGRCAFPAEWLQERRGYAVMGNHVSFGENRRKKGWREIESTFCMQLLKRDHSPAQRKRSALSG